MPSSGLSEDGLARLHDAMAAHVERGAMPGLIALVAHGGTVHVDVIGTGAFGDTTPIGRDAIFRIASLTKPIAAVAAMMLVEDGALHLDDAIDELLPELANRRVLRTPDAELDDTVAAVRPITVDDVLTFRLGLGHPMSPVVYPIQRAEEALDLKAFSEPWPPTPYTPDEWIGHLGSLPLIYQPGERWMYDTGGRVLGVLIERAAGMAFEALLQERIFGPLGMVDTGFSVPPDQLGRLTTAYTPDPESGALEVLDGVADSYWRAPPAFPSAASWLVSTIDDYWTFVQMMQNRGVHRGTRIISEASIELMTTDRLTRAQREGGFPILAANEGWGLGLMAPAADADARAIPGGYGWNGGTGTTWRTDAERDLTAILFTQRALNSPEPPAVITDFYNGVYRAIDH